MSGIQPVLADGIFIASDKLLVLAQLCEENTRREELTGSILSAFRPALSVLPNGKFTPLFQNTPIELLEIWAPMLRETCAMLAKGKDLGNGYSIRVNNEFRYEKNDNLQVFGGLFLELADPNGKMVGSLQFEIGVPFHVLCMQGHSSKLSGENRAQKFHAAAGKPYYEALLAHLIDCVGANMRFERSGPFGRPSKILLLLLSEPDEKLSHGLAKYVHKSEKPKFAKSGMGHIRPNFFAKPWRAAHGKLINPPAQAIPQAKKPQAIPL